MRSIITGAVALVGAAALAACANSGPTPGSAVTGVPVAAAGTTEVTTPTPAAAIPTPATSAPATIKPTPSRTPTRAATATSDLSQLKRLGITLNEGVLIDVADDDVDRYLAIGKNGVVGFTGTTRTDETMMALKAAPVSQRNRVVIKPPFYNEDLGAGSCVAAVSGAKLKLETCVAGKTTQIWTVVPAGDSGQFELHGSYGVIRVDGRVGLQTIKFAE